MAFSCNKFSDEQKKITKIYIILSAGHFTFTDIAKTIFAVDAHKTIRATSANETFAESESLFVDFALPNTYLLAIFCVYALDGNKRNANQQMLYTFCETRKIQ